MDKKIIVTIGRQFGSGGRVAGQKIAEALSIAYYDRELIAVAAKESGLSKEVFEKADEKAADKLAHAFTMGFSFMGMYTPHTDILSNEGLFKIQSDAIRKLAGRESCVLVGRCADYILRDDPACTSVFIHDTLENRIQRVVERQDITIEQARELILKTDKSRAAYYDYFTNKTWGMSSSYNLSVDISVLGMERTVRYILRFIEEKFSGSLPPL